MGNFNRGYKYRIYPTEEQKEQINDFITFTRFVYNWGIAKEKELYEQFRSGLTTKQLYTYFELDTLFRKEIEVNPKLFWCQKYPNTTTKLPFRNIYNGYKKFFKGTNINPPHFKKKNKCKKAFSTRNDRFFIKNNRVKIEGIDSYIDLKFDCGFNLSKVINPVVSKDTIGNYYISFNLKDENKDLYIPKTEGIGIDLGERRTFILSDGETYTQPKEKLDRLECKRRKLESHVTRDRKRRQRRADHTKATYEDIPKSKREIKRELKLNKTYKKIHNIKNTFYHTITKRIVDKNPEFVCMETIPVRQLQKDNPYLSSGLAQVSFYDIIQKMKYKCENYNIPFIQAPRDFASSKICSNCGNKKEIYGNHIYKCKKCGMRLDRDINAAINLKNYGFQFI